MKKLPVRQFHNCLDVIHKFVLLLFACCTLAIAGCSLDRAPSIRPGAVAGSALATPGFASTVTFATTDAPIATSTLVPTQTPAPTPTPTPDPESLIRQAQHAAFNGDDGQAVSLYGQALGMLPETHAEMALQALFGLGQSQLGAGDTAGAMSTFTSIISDAATGTIATDAHVLLGRTAAASGDASTAISHYSAAIAAGSAISTYLQQWIGDAYIAANQPVSAVVPYQRSLDGTSILQERLSLREKLAVAQQLSGQFLSALEQYDAILTVTGYEPYRARIQWQSAQVLQAMGQTSAAYQRMHDLVNNYADTNAAFSALQALIKAGQPVDELQRGIVDYHNGAYSAAQQAFRRAIAADSRINEVRYWAALNYSELNSPSDAYRNLNEIISAGPQALRYADALIEKGSLLAASGDVENAATVFRQLALSAPADPRAPLALQRVGRILERAGMLEQSAQAHLAAYEAYPQAGGASEALLRAAIALVRLGRYQEALSETQALVATYPAGAEAELARLWQGKAQIGAGQVVSGQATLAALAQTKPDDYEGTRAAELAADATRAPLSKLYGQVPTQTQDMESQQTQAETWLRARLDVSTTVDIHSLQPAIRGDARFAQGETLWRLGLKSEARNEFESLRAQYGKDALATYQLALYFRDIGLYRSSIGAADTLLRLVSAQSIADTPAYLARMVYPIYFPELVAQAAAEFALDPLLVASLIRQESLFEPFAASGASAYGLMQVVPGTGKEINSGLSWPPNYSDRDLTRPYVSLRFGTYYLSKQRDFLKGDLYAALAAYNGGPGMGQRWKDRSGGDPDAFFMTMPLDGSGYRETQLYIRTVAANYALYHRLYAGD